MMYDDFLMMLPNAIGRVVYFWDDENAVPKSQKEGYIDSFTTEVMHALVQRAMYEPGFACNPEVEFMKARESARNLMRKSGFERTLKTTEIQVGNKECLQFIQQLESNPSFRGWENENIILMYKKVTQDLINNNE